MGRRPKPKSDEFLESTPLVFEIITILCFETAEQVLYCLGARPLFEGFYPCLCVLQLDRAS